jgi:hypothetical protein
LGDLVLAGSTSGTVTLSPPASAGTTTLTLPTTSGTITTKDASGILSVNGIQFPATQSASADANCLDDYEEGTWSGNLTASNATGLSLTNAKYTKVGRLVTLTATVACTITSSNVLTYVVIGSYPFGFLDSTSGSAYLNNNTKVGFTQIAGGAVYAFFPAASAPVAGAESVALNISYFTS